MLEWKVLIEVEAFIARLGVMEFTDATRNLVLAVGTGTGEALHFMIQVILVK